MAFRPASVPIEDGTGTLTGRPLLSSQKSDLGWIYFQGDNLDEGMSTIYRDGIAQDEFAMADTPTRWPRVCRVTMARGTGGVVSPSFWANVGQQLSDELPGVCVVVGRTSSGGEAGHDWLLDALAGFGELADDVSPGEILHFVFTNDTQAYGISGIAPNAVYELHYNDWVAKFERYTNAAARLYQHATGGGGAEEVAQSAIISDIGGNTFSALGPPLSEFGWTLSNNATWDVVGGFPMNEMITRAKEFFGIE